MKPPPIVPRVPTVLTFAMVPRHPSPAGAALITPPVTCTPLFRRERRGGTNRCRVCSGVVSPVNHTTKNRDHHRFRDVITRIHGGLPIRDCT